MQRRRFILTLPAVMLGLIAQPSSAANSGQASSDGEVVFSRLLEIIDQAGTIIPGQGFKSIKLGDPFEKLVQLWGPPKNIGKKGTLSYLLSHKTVIHFLGKKHIETILVQGKPGSLAHINNGVVFGMSQEQVLTHFSKTPDKHNREVIRYKPLGIELGFKADVLAEVKIFQP